MFSSPVHGMSTPVVHEARLAVSHQLGSRYAIEHASANNLSYTTEEGEATLSASVAQTAQSAPALTKKPKARREARLLGARINKTKHPTAAGKNLRPLSLVLHLPDTPTATGPSTT